jgi:hypothetical protein
MRWAGSAAGVCSSPGIRRTRAWLLTLLALLCMMCGSQGEPVEAPLSIAGQRGT